MRNVRIGFAGALLCAGAMAALGCSSDDGTESDPTGSAGAGGGSGGGGAGGGSGGGGAGGTQTASASGCTMTQGGTMVTSLCSEAPLNALTPAEQVQLCSETGAYVAGAVDRAVSCKYVAIVASASSSAPTEAEMQAACSAREMACNQDDTIMGAGAMTQCSAIPMTCSATVAQYSACVLDQAVVFEQGATALTSCAMLTLANLSTVYDVPMAATNAPGCMALKTACPTFNLPYIN